eukprot:11179757-Lingulodinium_polyedra.AAC.1
MGDHSCHCPALADLRGCFADCSMLFAYDKVHYRPFTHGYAPTWCTRWISSIHHLLVASISALID